MHPTYQTTGTLQLNRVMHPAGSSVTITDLAEVARLRALGAIAPVDGAAPGTPNAFDASANVKTLVPQIRASDDAGMLVALRQAELNRPDGPRATVVGAIDERLDVIAVHEHSGEPDDTDEDDGE